jgi:hypothetical protein
MTLASALGRFAASITENFAQLVAASPEDQLKPPTLTLLREVGDLFGRRVIGRTEAHPIEAEGRPDIGVAVDGLLGGFMELKRPGLGSNPERLRGEQNRAQWRKFRTLPNLIYSDGNSWSLYRTGELIGRPVSISGDITADGAVGINEANVERFGALLRDFLTWQPIVPHAPRELAAYLAPLARLVRDEAYIAVRQEGSNIRVLADEWRAYLFPDADDHQFADAYAQTLTYALLLARVTGAGDLEPDMAARTLDAGNGLLAQTLRVLAQQDARREIELGYDPLRRALEALDPADFLRGGRDPWLYFYEDFLAAYDPKLRSDYGVYYTPVEVVRCQVHLIADLLRERFGRRLGFADDGVTFLDPALGTGTYPLAAVDHALSLVEQRSGPGAVPGRASQLARNFFGFEILVGPYAVSHLRLTQKIRAAGGNLPDGRLQVYLADSLESPNAQPAGLVTLMGRRLVEERRRARDVKANQRILVCFGNPPYDRQQIDPDDPDTQRKGGWVRFGDREQARVGQATPHAILEDFMAPVRAAGAGVHLKNLYNDYVYFWRWALWKLFEHQAGGGVVSFITAASYLAGPGFVGMREVMRRTFDELWIINLEGDNQGPRRTDNVFAIQTPVAIAVGVRGEVPDPDHPAPVHYVRVEGTRDEKLTWLRSIEHLDQIEWRDCPSNWSDPFLPVGIGIYPTLPLLTDIFPWHHSGAQFKRTWPIGATHAVVRQRWETLLRAPSNERAALFVETRDRVIGQTFDNGLPGSNSVSINTARFNEDQTSVVRYGHRSLCRAWSAFDTRLGDFLRPEIWQTASPHQVFLTSLLSHPIGVGPSATVTALIPDLHHYRGSFGGADAIPLYRDAAGADPNIARAALGAIQEVLGRGREVSAEDIFTYIYAVLASPQYVERFWEELIRPGPRIPITRDPALFHRGVAIGRRLIWLHTYGERMVPAGTTRGDVVQGTARCLSPISDRPAHYPEDFSYEPTTREIRVGNGRFGPVNAAVWEFSISGFEVVKFWLGYRRKDPVGRRSSPLDEFRPDRWTAGMTDEFLELLWTIEQTLAEYPELARFLIDVLDGPCFTAEELPLPTAAERRPPPRRPDQRQAQLV